MPNVSHGVAISTTLPRAATFHADVTLF